MKLSFIIPHKHTHLNDAACLDAIDSIRRYGTDDHEIIVDDRDLDPYVIWNDRIPKAQNDYVVFFNSDMYCAENYDIWISNAIADCEKMYGYKVIYDAYLVESGVMGVHPNNIEGRFGLNPFNFNEEAFQAFCFKQAEYKPPYRISPKMQGFVLPMIFHKQLFIDGGMFETDMPAHSRPNDLRWCERVEQQGAVWCQVKSFFYHYQRLSTYKPELNERQ